eukprot:5810991-Prymnesium_polylepis.1
MTQHRRRRRQSEREIQRRVHSTAQGAALIDRGLRCSCRVGRMHHLVHMEAVAEVTAAATVSAVGAAAVDVADAVRAARAPRKAAKNTSEETDCNPALHELAAAAAATQTKAVVSRVIPTHLSHVARVGSCGILGSR